MVALLPLSGLEAGEIHVMNAEAGSTAAQNISDVKVTEKFVSDPTVWVEDRAQIGSGTAAETLDELPVAVVREFCGIQTTGRGVAVN